MPRTIITAVGPLEAELTVDHPPRVAGDAELSELFDALVDAATLIGRYEAYGDHEVAEREQRRAEQLTVRLIARLRQTGGASDDDLRWIAGDLDAVRSIARGY